MTEQLVMPFEQTDKHMAAFMEFKASEEGGRFCDAVYKRVHVAMLDGRRLGIKRVVEDVRWDTKTAFNNNWAAPLSRWLLAKDVRFRKVFSTRERISLRPAAGISDELSRLHCAVGAIGSRLRREQDSEKLEALRG